MSRESSIFCPQSSVFSPTRQTPQEPRRVADVDARFGDVFRHHGAGADDDVVADGDGQDRGVCADAHAIADPRGAPQVLAALSRAACGKHIVHEHNTMRDETVISDRHELADEGMRLNLRAAPNRYAFLYFDKRAYKAVIANGTPVDIRWRNDLDIPSEKRVDYCRVEDQGRVHDGLAARSGCTIVSEPAPVFLQPSLHGLHP